MAIEVTYNFLDDTTASRNYGSMNDLMLDLDDVRNKGFLHYANEDGSLTLVPIQHLSHIDVVDTSGTDPVFRDMVS